jgi:hypothetical protein
MELYRNGRSQKTTFIHFEHFSINRQNIFNVLKLQQQQQQKQKMSAKVRTKQKNGRITNQHQASILLQLIYT